jgi:hypothetical protein
LANYSNVHRGGRQSAKPARARRLAPAQAKPEHCVGWGRFDRALDVRFQIPRVSIDRTHQHRATRKLDELRARQPSPGASAAVEQHGPCLALMARTLDGPE